MAGQALSTSQCTPNVLLYLPNHAVNAHQRAGHASFQHYGEYGTTPGDITPRMYPNARAYAKKVLASQGVFHLDTAPSWSAHPRPAPHPAAVDANAGGNYLTGDVSHTHLRHHPPTPAALQGHPSHGHAYQFANMQGLHPNNVVTTLTLDPNFLPTQFSGTGMGGASAGGGAYTTEVNCASQNVSLGPRTNSRCDSVRSEAAESSCSSLSADSQSDYMGGASTATFNHQLNQSWYANYRGNASSSSSSAAAAMTGNMMNYGNACNSEAHSAAGSHYAKTSNFPNRPYNCHWSYAENNVNSAGISPQQQQQHQQQRYMNYAWNATHAMNAYARNPSQHSTNHNSAYWASATPTQAPHHQRRDVNQNEMKECWNVMQNQSNTWAKYAPPTGSQTNYAPLTSDTPCGRDYASVGVASVEESQTGECEDQGDKEYEHRDMGGEVRKTDDVSTGSVTCMVPPQRRESCSNNSDNSQVLANSSDDLAVAKVKVNGTSEENGACGRGSTQTVVTPWGWERLIVSDAVVYVSPSGTRLHCCQELRQYLQQNGTCKCGLPCPLRLDQVFDFNPVVSCNSATSPPTWESCSHNRSCSDAKTVPITTSCGENESENTPSGTEESAPPAGTNSTTSSATASTKSHKSNKRSAAGTPPGQKSKKLKLATPSGANAVNQSTPSSSTTTKRRSPCPNVDVRQLSVEYNRPPVGGYLASLSQPRCTSNAGSTGQSTSSLASPKMSVPSFLDDPSGYLAQQTVLLHSTIACQSSIENEKLTFSPNKNQGTSTPVKTPPVAPSPSPSPSAPSSIAPPTPTPAHELPESTKNTSTTGSEVEIPQVDAEPEPENGQEPETSEFIGDLLDCIPDSMELSSDGLSANESKDSGYKSFAGLIPSSSSSLSVSDTPPQPVPAEQPVPEVPAVTPESTETPPQVPVPTPPSVVSTTNSDTPTEPPEPLKPAPKVAPKGKSEKSARKVTTSLSKKSRKTPSNQNGLSKSPKMKKLSPVLTPTTPQPLYTTTGSFMGGVNPATNCWGSHAFTSNDRLTHTRSVLPAMAPHTPMVQVLNVNGAILQPSMDNANPVILQAPPSFVPSARDSTGGRCIMPRIEAPPGHPSATPLNHPPPPSKPSRGKKRKSAPQTVASILHGVQSNPNNAMNSWSNPAHTQPMPATPSTELPQQFQAATCLPIPFSGGQMGSLNSNVPTLALMPDGKTYVVLNQLNPQPQPFNSGTITLNAFNTVHSVSTLQGPWLVNPSVNMNPLITTANLNLSLVQNQGMPTFVVPQGVIVNQLPDGTLVGTDPNVQLQIQNVATMVNQNAGAGTHNHGNALLSPQQTQQLLRSNEPPRPGLPGGAMSKIKNLGAISTNQVGTMPVQTVLAEQRVVTTGNGLMRQATATQTSRSLSPDSQTSVTSTLERDGSISRGEATPPGLTLVAAAAEQSPVVQSCLIDSCVTEESPSGGGASGVAGTGGGVGGNGRGEETESDLDEGISSSKLLEFSTSQVALQTPTPMVMAVPLAATQQIM